jgi:hypothetical protein
VSIQWDYGTECEIWEWIIVAGRRWRQSAEREWSATPQPLCKNGAKTPDARKAVALLFAEIRPMDAWVTLCPILRLLIGETALPTNWPTAPL